MFSIKKVFLSILLLVFISGFATEIKVLSKIENYRVINRKNNKIYHYYKLNPDEILKFKTTHKDSVVIFSRIILNNEKKTEYSYKIFKPNSEKNIIKKTTKSKQTKGLNGEIISSYNKYKFKTKKERGIYKIENSSSYELLIKIKDDDTKNLEKLEYVPFSPSFYSKEIILKIADKEYTYYSGNSQNIEFVLEGPIYLKFVSRLLYNSANNEQRNYTFSVIDNEVLKTQKTISTFQSPKTLVISESDQKVSKGDVQIIRLETGTHRIKFKTDDNSLIYRFYISKKSIG
ncbi:MAG: hypothetical protein K8S23_07790 [Candidatus Cloacimonetes bacterium]|nr:hypothetical protein [Candidatus Cloacimonadota bacterium]